MEAKAHIQSIREAEVRGDIEASIPVAPVESAITADDEQLIREMFEVFDTDEGGTIDISELTAALVNLNITDSKEETDMLAEQVNPNVTSHGGEMDFEAFRKSMRRLLAQRDTSSEMYQAFLIFSEGKDRITLSDLRRISLDLSDERTETFLQEMFVVGDRDHDGVINFQDFKFMMETAIHNERNGLVSARQVLWAANTTEGYRL